MLVAAAISHKGVTYTGVRHCEIFQDIIRTNPATKLPIKNSESHQGFVTDKNEFLNRAMALDHAIDCEQIKFTINGQYDMISGVLTSEDLW